MESLLSCMRDHSKQLCFHAKFVIFFSPSTFILNGFMYSLLGLYDLSKTDPSAKACVRTWGCFCDVLPERVCPYHVFVRYRTSVIDVFGADRVSGALPVFPANLGTVVTKASMVEGSRAVAALAQSTGGEEPTSP